MLPNYAHKLFGTDSCFLSPTGQLKPPLALRYQYINYVLNFDSTPTSSNINFTENQASTSRSLPHFITAKDVKINKCKKTSLRRENSAKQMTNYAGGWISVEAEMQRSDHRIPSLSQQSEDHVSRCPLVFQNPFDCLRGAESHLRE